MRGSSFNEHRSRLVSSLRSCAAVVSKDEARTQNAAKSEMRLPCRKREEVNNHRGSLAIASLSSWIS